MNRHLVITAFVLFVGMAACLGIVLQDVKHLSTQMGSLASGADFEHVIHTSWTGVEGAHTISSASTRGQGYEYWLQRHVAAVTQAQKTLPPSPH